MTNQLVERGYLTQSLGSASHSGEHGFKAVPGLLKRAIEQQAWGKRLIVETGEEFDGFRTLEEYIKANPPRGLGANVELIDRLIGKDEDLRAKFYQTLRRSVGNPNFSNHQQNTIVDNINSSDKGNRRPTGTSKAYALQKLSDEGQVDLLQQVKGGKLSASAAMKKAGFRRPKIAISLDNPESAAKTLLAHASPEFLEELKRLLS
jgi:hypothetical protein